MDDVFDLEPLRAVLHAAWPTLPVGTDYDLGHSMGTIQGVYGEKWLLEADHLKCLFYGFPSGVGLEFGDGYRDGYSWAVEWFELEKHHAA